MARSGVWDLQDVRDKLLAGDDWTASYSFFTWGDNEYGEVGDNSTTQRSSPIQMSGSWAYQATSFSCGFRHSGAVKQDGTLWTWGYNLSGGPLGLNDYANRSSPTQVGTETTWRSVSAGYDFTLATKTDGTLWSWGANSAGRLGLNETGSTASPKQIGTGTGWSSIIEAGNYRGYAITTGGGLQGWGMNGPEGPLGDNSKTTRSAPVSIPGGGWKSVTATSSNGLGISGSTLKTWGKNAHGQLGINNTSGHKSSPQNVPGTWTSVAHGVNGGEDKSVAIRADGTMWAMGDGSNALGLGDSTKRSSPTQIGTGTTWKNLSTGVYESATNSLAIKTDGTMWAWGSNNYGNSGRNNKSGNSEPLQVGEDGDGWYECDASPRFAAGIKQSFS